LPTALCWPQRERLCDKAREGRQKSRLRVWFLWAEYAESLRLPALSDVCGPHRPGTWRPTVTRCDPLRLGGVLRSAPPLTLSNMCDPRRRRSARCDSLRFVATCRDWVECAETVRLLALLKFATRTDLVLCGPLRPVLTRHDPLRLVGMRRSATPANAVRPTRCDPLRFVAPCRDCLECGEILCLRTVSEICDPRRPGTSRHVATRFYSLRPVATGRNAP
jgi:hypothetical protein